MVRLFLVVFVVVLMVMAICFRNVLTLLLLRFAKILNLTISWRWIRVIGPVACCGMVGFPFFLELVMGHLGLLVLMMLPSTFLRVLWVLIPLIFSRVRMSLRVLIGILLLIGCLLHLMFGLMVVLFVMRFLVLLALVLVFMLACMLITGGTGVGGILMILVLLLMVCPLHVWVLALCRGPLQTVQRAEFWGVVLALQATNAVHLGVDNLNVVRHVGRLLNGLSSVRPLSLWMMVTLLSLSVSCSPFVVRILCVFLRSRVMMRVVWPVVAKCGPWIVMVILVLMKLLTLVVVGFGLMLLMLGGVFLVSLGCGILLFCFCVVSLLPLLVLSLIVMTLLVWHLILLFGLLGAFQRGAVLLMLFGMLLCFQVLFIFWILVGLVFLSVFGRTLLISWSSWLLFWVLFINPLLVVI